MTEAVEVKPHNISQEDSPEADDGWNILEEVVRDGHLCSWAKNSKI